jgi:hypothetical protein
VRAALGFSIHTGWAAAVTVGGPPAEILARARLELADEDSRFVYHVAAERGDAERRIADAARIARQRAEAGLRLLIEQHPVAVAVLPPQKRELPPLAIILAAHPLLHAAEGELYRRAIAGACADLGIAVDATTAVALPVVGKVSPPWGKDQKDAAALAWAGLTLRPGSTSGRSID